MNIKVLLGLKANHIMEKSSLVASYQKLNALQNIATSSQSVIWLFSVKIHIGKHLLCLWLWEAVDLHINISDVYHLCKILLFEFFRIPTGYTLRKKIGSVAAVGLSVTDLIVTLSQHHRFEFIVTCLSVRGFNVTCFRITCGMSYLASICIHFSHLQLSALLFLFGSINVIFCTIVFIWVHF